MGVSCQILIDKKKEGVHKAGETVTGVVKYAFDEPAQYKAITLSFLGTGKCSWTETLLEKDTQNYIGSEEYVSIHREIIDKEKGNAAYEIGSYAYKFEFLLPENIPSSFKNNTCTISYRVQVTFKKSDFFSFTKKFDTEIPVYGYVEPIAEGPVVFGLKKTLMNLLATDNPVVNLRAEIVKAGLQPGENAQLSLVVTNDSDVVPTVWTELYCTTTYKADCGKTNTSSVKIKGCSSEKTEVPKRSVANLSQTIPISPELYSITSRVMQKKYQLKVTVRLPIPHVNAVVEMPLVIGERKGEMDGSVKELEESGSSRGELEIGQEVMGEEPPSYWEAMFEDKEKYNAQCKV